MLRDNKRILGNNEFPAVTIVIAAYNEAPFIKKKIEDTLAIDYPKEKLKIIFVTDGSTDGSEKIVGNNSSVLVLHQVERKGKSAAISRAMQFVKTPIVIFSDVNTMLNKECIQRIVPHYANKKTGGVAGEKRIINNQNRSAVGEAEGLYWKYESLMKKQDADFNTVVGAAGELFSIRTELFSLPAENIILDDFVISMQACLKGYTIKYEPGAFATELPSVSLKEEMKRKIRISAGAYQSIAYLKSALNIFKYPLLSFQYISRRLLRWVFCPLMLIAAFVTNVIIVSNTGFSSFFGWFLCAQLFFYILAFFGWIIITSGKRAVLLTVPFYFLFMNYCLVKGFFKFLRGTQTVLWEKSVRHVNA